jgi:hypothetical protein
MSLAILFSSLSIDREERQTVIAWIASLPTKGLCGPQAGFLISSFTRPWLWPQAVGE